MLAEAFHSTADTGNELASANWDKTQLASARRLASVWPRQGSLLLLAAGCYLHFQHRRRTGPTSGHFSSSTSGTGAARRLELPCAGSGGGIRFLLVANFLSLLSRKDPDESTWDEIIGSKDPTVFTVFLEDTAGLIGAILAFLGIFLGRLLHNQYLDPIASILIGLLLRGGSRITGSRKWGLAGGRASKSSPNQESPADCRGRPPPCNLGPTRYC